MNAWLYLYPAGLDAPDEHWPVSCWPGPDDRHDLTLAEAAAFLAGNAARVVLPMELCSWLRSEPWPGRRRPTAQALAYALEEQLTDDPDHLHLVVGEPDSARRYPLWVVDKVRFGGIVELLRQSGLRLMSVQVDADLLPPGQPHGVWWGGRWLLGGALEMRLALPEPAFQQLLARLPADVCRLDHAQSDRVRELLGAGQGTELLQGPFRPAGLHKPWRPLLATLLALFVLSWGFTQVRSHDLETRAAQLYAQSVRHFQALYPQQTRVVDLAAQLRALAADETEKTRQMARLVQLVEQVIGGSGVEVQRIEYRAGTGWTLALTTGDFTELERLRERGRQQQLPIRLGTASKERSRVRALLTLAEQNR
ncbi:type II secretion system protein GspL [Pseudomonas vanderleydeniana]|uniref:Type II secretion system protein L n=1 Tax=Pseudomonas vanderleydeniana TaxID=2745495 RepID=A0A9E6PM79_9PSED|nr:type II secretion system protein GspL [Pseudomonas vanderleydeniana]QXI28971.1 general secretion pathway protein GspL [Pseudomonas vanderleydeniana]